MCNNDKSSLTEVEQLELQADSLKRALDIAELKHRLGILSAEAFLDYLKRLYGYNL